MLQAFNRDGLKAPQERNYQLRAGFFFCFKVYDVPEDYRVVLSPFPRGISVLNTFFFCSATSTESVTVWKTFVKR